MMEDKQEKESPLEISLKINTGEYRLVKKNKRSTVWNVYREIAKQDGTKLKWRYYCVGCKRVMQSTGGTTSNLRIHKCHIRYLKHNSLSSNNTSAVTPTQPQHTNSNRKTTGARSLYKINNSPQYEEFYDKKFETDAQFSDDENEMEHPIEAELHEENEHEPELHLSTNTRPLLKFFSEESWSAEMAEEQPIELDNVDISEPQDFKEETITPSVAVSVDPSELAEAESYAKAWAHAFLKLNEEQKFYAKRSIDELLVLGRLERLSISTVTSLTTNL